MVDFAFNQLWEYTKLTFRLLAWVFHGVIRLTNLVLHFRQSRHTPPAADLFPSSGKHPGSE